MKKSFLFCLAALTATLLSCEREEDAVIMSAGTDAPGEEVQLQHIATDFRASIPSTKTAVDMGTGTVTWLTDDPILVSNGDQSMTLYVEEGGSTYAALYSTEAVIDGNSFYAVYPASVASYADGVFMASIPTRQTYHEGGFSSETFPMIAVSDARRHFSFRNIASLLKIVVSSEDFKDLGVSSLTLTSDSALSGIISATIAESGEILIDSSQGEKTVTVDASENPAPIGKPIYVVVPPGDFGNLQASVTLSNGLGYSFSVDGTVSVNRSAYREVPFTVSDDFTDLSLAETANCYMITQPGKYKFRADVKGNGVTTSCGLDAATAGITEAKTYYRDGSNFLVGDPGYHDGYIYFQTTGGELPVGTVLVSALNAEGKTLWSWHIWANKDIKDVELSNGSVWLNMNLGAHQVSFNKEGYNGYFYQWGRKDPFLQKYTEDAKVATLTPFVSHASMTDGSLMNSIANPHIFYGGYHPSGVTDITEDWSTYDDNEVVYDWWNKDITGDGQNAVPAAKTMFDPCPAGYHVPVYSDLAGLLEMALADDSATSGGRTIEGKLFFPFTSYRYVSLNLSWWPGGGTESRAFIPSATPSSNAGKSMRRFSRMYLSSTGVHKLTNGARSYGVPVRCIKDVQYVPVMSVSLDKTALELVEEGTYVLTATVLPGNATEKALQWSSSDESVATVDEGGKITAVKEGTAVITAASSSGPTATCAVTVKPKVVPATSVTLNKTQLELVEGGSYLLSATVLPDNATDKTLQWSSSNEAVATVTQGRVNAISEGSAVITVTAASGKSANCTVTVKKSGGGFGGDIEGLDPDDWN